MKRFLLALALVWMIQPSNVLAHPGGHGPVNENQAMGIALYAAEQLADFDAGLGFGQLEATWKNLPVERTRIHKWEWIFHHWRGKHIRKSNTLRPNVQCRRSLRRQFYRGVRRARMRARGRRH